MSIESPVIAVTSGEPAGIGPDICVALATRAWPMRIATVGDPAVLAARAQALGAAISIVPCRAPSDVGAARRGVLQVLPIEAASPVVPGRLDPRNAGYVLELIKRGAELCASGACAALTTAPVQKSVINSAGVAFSGHTELLAELTHAALPVMLLASKRLRVALATTHLPLGAVPAALDGPRLERIVTIIATDLEARFGVAKPRIAVLGLNPHAGESGVLGKEEQTIIAPAIERARARGIDAFGPLPADTAFTPEALERCDVVLAMYHDQGLPVIKALGFGEIVNVTLGLPIIRTSVDHGTALALAGTGQARPESLFAAVALAAELARRAKDA
ncbi:MAG TPA: 4-hydroxythreonine-4-phosphate dehydrogenase PdxA [Gammaproteobacteria bacterium]|jgi:4-hydroxythreonine-4-phosphate dehydrogenase